MEGKKHKKKALSGGNQENPESMSGGSSTSSSMMSINQNPIVKKCFDIPDFSTVANTNECVKSFYDRVRVVKDMPRHYQHDLYRRILLDEFSYLCYLPTGYFCISLLQTFLTHSNLD